MRKAVTWALAFSVVAAVAAGPAAAQQREPERFALLDAPAPEPAVDRLQAPQEDQFDFVGFLLFGAAGTVAGAYIGYHVDRYFGWSQGDDPGLGGFFLGAVIGGTAGMIFGGHLGND